MADDAAGNQTQAPIEIVWTPGLILSVGSPAESREGQKVVFPISLRSAGQVGGMHFVLRYNADFLGQPVFTWSSAVSLSQNNVNLSIPGQVDATFSFADRTLPAGVQLIGALELRARSVPFPLNTEVEPEILDISNGLGDPITEGIDAFLGVVRVNQRRFAGDINANGRLDIGDATLLQRLIVGTDVARSWDLGLSDLNQNNQLDSGDVTRILRVVTGLSTQPGFGMASVPLLRQNELSMAAGPQASLSPDSLSGKAGAVFTVQIRLQNLSEPISGAFFRLRYPRRALQLASEQSFKVGALVPSDATKVWNSVPGEGLLSFAASSSKAWPAANGMLAEITLRIASGIPDSTTWALALEQVEVSTDGFQSPAIILTGAQFKSGTAFPPPELGGIQIKGQALELNVTSDINDKLLVEFSEDLRAWKPWATLPPGSGAFQLTGSAAPTGARGFFRLKAAVPGRAPILIQPGTRR